MNQETAYSAPQLDDLIRNFSVLLSSTPRGARLARLLATEQLRMWGLPLHPADLVVAELAANADLCASALLNGPRSPSDHWWRARTTSP